MPHHFELLLLLVCPVVLFCPVHPSVLLLLSSLGCCPATSAASAAAGFVGPTITQRRAVRGVDATQQPPRPRHSLWVLKNELDSEEQDYMLQTEDYSIMKHPHEGGGEESLAHNDDDDGVNAAAQSSQHHFSSSFSTTMTKVNSQINHHNLQLSRDLQKYFQTANSVNDHNADLHHGNDHEHGDNTALERVKRHMLHLPRRWGPGWQQHHHATVNFVHHRLRNNNNNNNSKLLEVNNYNNGGDQQQQQQQHEIVIQSSRYLSALRTTPFAAPANSNTTATAGDYETHIEDTDSVLHHTRPPFISNAATTTATSLSSPSSPLLISSSIEWQRLVQHAERDIQHVHLRELLQDSQRSQAFYASTHDAVYLDYSRQRITRTTLDLLLCLAAKQQLQQKINDMFRGEKINFTEDRAVLHTALRAPKDKIGSILLPQRSENDADAAAEPLDVVGEVHQVLDQIKEFTDGVRSGGIRGYTGKRLRNIVSVGIGGSYLGPEFLHECLKTEPEGITAALGYNLRFLANVDPVDVERTVSDLDPEETLIVIVSKTFTTAETMLNARTMRQWLWDFMGNDKDVVRKHMVACASISATQQVQDFGIDTSKYFFRFWDWVGGRYSVCSAAGAVPISLLYGFDLFEKFLQGAHSIDEHFLKTPFHKNIPVLMGLLGVWNMSFLNYRSRTTLPYAEALLKLPAHIQQLDMESNGKSMTRQGVEVDYPVGEIDFGEAGTNGQHSFYQLLHMGQTVPCDFIGFVQSQHDFCLDGEELSSHDELMANFFAQPDALATGKTEEEVRAEGVPEHLIKHKVFKGNRPSLSLLLPKLTAYACGQLLAIYEHRTAVQGFIWDINSFDQWGVELGKKLACDVRNKMMQSRRESGMTCCKDGDDNNEGKKQHQPVETSNPATTRLLNYYLENSRNTCHEETQAQGNSLTRVTRTTHRDHRSRPPPPPLRHDLKPGSTLS